MAAQSEHNPHLRKENNYGGYASIIGKTELAWGLIIIGFALVLFAPHMGVISVTHYVPNSNTREWSQDEANRATESLRYIGIMLFAAGYAERILLKLSAR